MYRPAVSFSNCCWPGLLESASSCLSSSRVGSSADCTAHQYCSLIASVQLVYNPSLIALPASKRANKQAVLAGIEQACWSHRPIGHVLFREVVVRMETLLFINFFLAS